MSVRITPLRLLTRSTAVALAAVLVAAPAGLPAAPAAAATPFPGRIDLPDGFAPEGIAVGRGTTVYVGSIPTGDLWRGDLRTGAGEVIHDAAQGSAAIGLAVDAAERVWVAGGGTGTARVVDGTSGSQLAAYQLVTGSTFVNDVEVTRDAAWFTDSVNPVLYRVPTDLGPATTVPLTGDLVYRTGFNVNGIEATPDGATLLLVQSNTGKLFTADPATGVTREIDLGGESVPTGDGILLAGHTLYVLQNRLNQVAVVELAGDLGSGEVVARLTHPDFAVPTTFDRFGSSLYAVNARFGTPVTPTTDYWITRL